MVDKLVTLNDDPRAIDVIAALNEQNDALRPEDRQAKYEKMSTSPFVFYRGSNHLFWKDFADDARLKQFGSSKTHTWLQGDLHVENFGAFGNDAGVVVYDINDFDESVVADYQYDLWRMAVSILLVARQENELSAEEQENVVEDFCEAYLETVADYCKNDGEHDVIFDRDNTFGRLDNLIKKVEKKNTREEMLADWTVDGKFKVAERPDKLAEITPAMRDGIMAGMQQYRTETLANIPEGAGDNYFEVRDIARRLSAGTGSLGTPRFYVLIKGENDLLSTDRILDVKLQSMPVPYRFLSNDDKREYNFFTREAPGHDAVWHAAAYRAMATDTDDHLGWMQLSDGFYSVRERSFYKETMDLEELDSKNRFSNLAKQWGMIIATDHSRALTDFIADFPEVDLTSSLFQQESDPKAFKCRVAERTNGEEDAFLETVKEIAFEYADQVEADWAFFKEVFP